MVRFTRSTSLLFNLVLGFGFFEIIILPYDFYRPSVQKSFAERLCKFGRPKERGGGPTFRMHLDTKGRGSKNAGKFRMSFANALKVYLYK